MVRFCYMVRLLHGKVHGSQGSYEIADTPNFVLLYLTLSVADLLIPRGKKSKVSKPHTTA